jgi:hypothetical protein
VRNVHKILVIKSEGKGHTRWKDNIKMYLKYIILEYV